MVQTRREGERESVSAMLSAALWFDPERILFLQSSYRGVSSDRSGTD
jgi:hypothetical protein